MKKTILFLLAIAVVLIAFFSFYLLNNSQPKDLEKGNNSQLEPQTKNPKYYSVTGVVTEASGEKFRCEISQIVPDGNGGGELKKQTVTVTYDKDTKFEIVDRNMVSRKDGNAFDIKPGVRVVVVATEDSLVSATLPAVSVKVVK